MVCYILPTAAALAVWGLRKKGGWSDAKFSSLNLLFVGAAVFGVIDHLWNGELFLVGPNVVSDIALGVTITLSVVVVWLALLAFESRDYSETKA